MLKRARCLLKNMLLVAAGLFVAVQLWYAGWVLWYRDHNPALTAFMRHAIERREARYHDSSLRHRYVPYSRISSAAKRAVIGAEDSKFASHYGFDFEGIEHAMKKNLREGERVAGGSTITQQLAKNLFLSGRRSYLRKAQEAIITVEMETLLSKQRILELYLNYAEWGDGLYGIDTASRYYYGIPASQLGPWQASHLAAMLPKPRYYQRVGTTDWLAQKTDIIQRRLPNVILP